MMRWIMRLFGGRAHTILNTPPAPIGHPELEAEARLGKIQLDHLARRAERTVAASQELFVARAAGEILRRL